MDKVYDSSTDCRLLYSSPAQNKSTLILLRSKLSAATHRLGISDLKKENMLLVASEMVSNQIKHADGRGMLQLWQQPGPVLDILALDYGPGIANLYLAEKDGYSTTNTLGKGLGTIRRLSDESYTYTQQESAGQTKKWSGAIFLSRFHFDTSTSPTTRSTLAGLKIGMYSNSLSNSHHNGDRIYLHQVGKKLHWLHLDGLGHGAKAQAATDNLAVHLARHKQPAALLAAVDKQLVGTRGAVAIIGEIDLAQETVQLLGVGDMHAHYYDREQLYNVAFKPGILGREHRSTTPFHAEFGKKCIILTASDGIRRNLDIMNFVGLFNQPPQLIAYTLGNIMGRISDDQSLFVSTVE